MSFTFDSIELTKAMIQARMAIEMVASAKGSPMTRPNLKVERAPYRCPFSIFCNDGEPREPYDGIWREEGRRGARYYRLLFPEVRRGI